MLQPMLLSSGDTCFDDPEWSWEVKWDGIRCVAHAGRGAVRLFTRRRRDITAQFPEVAAAVLAALDGQAAVLDGELVCPAPDGRPDFYAVAHRQTLSDSGRIARSAERKPACLMTFDIMELAGRRLTGQPLVVRRALLKSAVACGRSIQAVPAWPGTSGTAVAAAVQEQRLEGLVGKRLDSLYRPGARSPDWIKVKFWLTSEVAVLGIRREPFAALVGEPGGAPLGTVELGWRPEHVAVVRRLLPDLQLSAASGLVWLKPYLRCRIRHRLNPDGRLREAVFTGFILP